MDRLLRRVLPYTTVTMLVAMLYAGWTIYSRHSENQRLERAAKDAELRRAAALPKVYQSNELKT